MPSLYVQLAYIDIVLCVPDFIRIFQRDERVLVIWSYNLDNIIPTCKDFEDKLIKLVWNQRSAFASLVSSTVASTTGSDVNLTEKTKEAGVVDDKEVAAIVEKKKTGKKSKRRCGLGYWFSDQTDVEKTADGPSPRPVRLFAPFYGGVAAALSLCSFTYSPSMLLVVSDMCLQTTWAVASTS